MVLWIHLPLSQNCFESAEADCLSSMTVVFVFFFARQACPGLAADPAAMGDHRGLCVRLLMYGNSGEVVGAAKSAALRVAADLQPRFDLKGVIVAVVELDSGLVADLTAVEPGALALEPVS